METFSKLDVHGSFKPVEYLPALNKTRMDIEAYIAIRRTVVLLVQGCGQGRRKVEAREIWKRTRVVSDWDLDGAGLLCRREYTATGDQSSSRDSMLLQIKNTSYF